MSQHNVATHWGYLLSSDCVQEYMNGTGIEQMNFKMSVSLHETFVSDITHALILTECFKFPSYMDSADSTECLPLRPVLMIKHLSVACLE